MLLLYYIYLFGCLELTILNISLTPLYVVTVQLTPDTFSTPGQEEDLTKFQLG